MLTRTPFYFLRHGETDWNRRRIMQGHTDTPLNACGVEQAKSIARDIADLEIATICCSPLLRARQTAAEVNAPLNRPVVIIDALKECAFGVYEGEPSNGAWRDSW